MSWNWGGENVNTDVTYDFASDIEMNFKTDVEYKSDTYVDADIDVKVDIKGNLATFNADVQAFGNDTAVELNLVAFTTEDFSSVTMSGYAATG